MTIIDTNLWVNAFDDNNKDASYEARSTIIDTLIGDGKVILLGTVHDELQKFAESGKSSPKQKKRIEECLPFMRKLIQRDKNRVPDPEKIENQERIFKKAYFIAKKAVEEPFSEEHKAARKFLDKYEKAEKTLSRNESITQQSDYPKRVKKAQSLQHWISVEEDDKKRKGLRKELSNLIKGLPEFIPDFHIFEQANDTGATIKTQDSDFSVMVKAAKELGLKHPKIQDVHAIRSEIDVKKFRARIEKEIDRLNPQKSI